MPFLQSPLWATQKTILAEAFEHSGPVASSGACCWSLPGSFKIHGDFSGIVCHIEGHEIKGFHLVVTLGCGCFINPMRHSWGGCARLPCSPKSGD